MYNYQSSNISNKSIRAVSRAPVIFHVQIKFNAATHFRPSSLMRVSPSRWWTANWQISQPWVWNYCCLYTSSLRNHV